MQHNFKRYEKKYLITNEQAAAVEAALSDRMMPDQFDSYWVQNLYFDTDNWDVIHTSMQQPYYKEKLRLRYYGRLGAAEHAYLELKKKCDGVVYKRRVALSVEGLEKPLEDMLAETSTQIARELGFYLQSTQVREKMFIAFRRKAFAGKEDVGLRVTFDSDIRYRLDQLHFEAPGEGRLVLHEGYQVMEIKTRTSIPLWLARLCSEAGIFATPYSKYATCYTDYTQQSHTGRTAVSC
ncbi:MAG: polyphosphate polymerase domain-containing protein [Oscillospiraceae bacterium]|nr:polyphosphate polymerase domain-containing protein [Oscillospiraceae bacterium]